MVLLLCSGFFSLVSLALLILSLALKHTYSRVKNKCDFLSGHSFFFFFHEEKYFPYWHRNKLVFVYVLKYVFFSFQLDALYTSNKICNGRLLNRGNRKQENHFELSGIPISHSVINTLTAKSGPTHSGHCGWSHYVSVVSKRFVDIMVHTLHIQTPKIYFELWTICY